jgi:hypothetical protein
MPTVPRDVAEAMANACVDEQFTARGGPAALERFYAHMLRSGRAPQRVRTEDFAAVTTSRTGLAVLLKALELADPSVPLAPARPLRQDWDRWLNDRYNVRPRKGRSSTRVALLPEDWPASWATAEPLLDRRVRVQGRLYRPLAPKTRDSIVQAVGLCAAARPWAQRHGVVVPEAFSADLAEAFLRFLVRERDDLGRERKPVTMRTAANYFGRVMIFGRRARLLGEEADTAFSDIHAALESEASDATPTKHAKIRRFLSHYGLADLLHAAARCMKEAEDLPAHSAAAFRLRRKAVVFALLVNGADRQGDLSTFTIGREIGRQADGLWGARFRQSKTGGRKDLGPYWPVTSRIIDHHILAGRPDWLLEDRLVELDGCNLLGLEDGALSIYHPTALLKEEFGISGHLVRTLLTDLVRVHRPDADWAVKTMLGHMSRWMQSTYRTDFRETAALEKYNETIAQLAGYRHS